MPQGQRPAGRRGTRGRVRVSACGDTGGLEAAFAGERQVERRRRGVAPGVGGVAGEAWEVGAGLGRQGVALALDEALGAGLAAVVGDSGEAEVAEVAGEVGEVIRRGEEGLGRVERVGKAAQSAVPGMNWAMPWAPAGLTAEASKRLSFQISRAKKLGSRRCGGRPSRSRGRRRRRSWPRRMQAPLSDVQCSAAPRARRRGQERGDRRVPAGSARAGAARGREAPRGGSQGKEVLSPGHGRETSGGKAAVPEGRLRVLNRPRRSGRTLAVT